MTFSKSFLKPNHHIFGEYPWSREDDLLWLKWDDLVQIIFKFLYKYVCTYTCCHSDLKFCIFKKMPDEIIEIEIRVVTKKDQ